MPAISAAVNLDSIRYQEQASNPATPAATYIQTWASDDSKFKSIDSGALVMNYSASIANATADTTIANTITETTLFSTTTGTLTLPAAFLIAGRTIRITMRGYVSTTGTPNITIRSKLGGAEMVGTGAFSLGTVSSVGFTYTSDIVCRSTGASGTVVSSGLFAWSTSTQSAIKTTTTTVDTTGTLAIDVTAEWGTASASNTITSQIASIEVLG